MVHRVLRADTFARRAEEASRKIPSEPPDVVLMDITAGMSGIECLRRLKERLPQLQIIMLTIEEDSRRCSSSGSRRQRLLGQHLPPAEILEAIQEIHH